MTILPRAIVGASVLSMIACGTLPTTAPTPSSGAATGADGTHVAVVGSAYVGCRGGKGVEYWAAHVGDITPSDLATLVSLPLKNGDGSNFDPVDQNSLSPWLKSGTKAVDLYGLSVQLAVATLNIAHGFVDPNAVAVLVQQAQIQLSASNPAAGWTEELVREFNRCQ